MVFEKVKQILAEQLSIDEDGITMKTTFEDLGADSLEMVELIMEMEDEFDVQIADEDVENIKTVGDFVDYIKEHVDENADE